MFTYRSVKPHLTELLSTTPLNCGAAPRRHHYPPLPPFPKPPPTWILPRAVMLHSGLSHTTSTRASLGTSSREALPDWLAVLPAPFPAGQGYWQSRLARPRRWPEPGPPSSLRWPPPRQTTENRRAREDNRTWGWRRGDRGGRERSFQVQTGNTRGIKPPPPPPPSSNYSPGKDIKTDS